MPASLPHVCVHLSTLLYPALPLPASAQTLGSQGPKPAAAWCTPDWQAGLSLPLLGDLGSGSASLTWTFVPALPPPPTADALQTHNTVFQEHAAPSSPGTAPTSRGFRRASEISIASQVSGMAENCTASGIAQSECHPRGEGGSGRRAPAGPGCFHPGGWSAGPACGDLPGRAEVRL